VRRNDDNKYWEVAERIARARPQWLVIWGVYSRRFWGSRCLIWILGWWSGLTTRMPLWLVWMTQNFGSVCGQRDRG
jgi:hypothetical protein